MRLTDHIPASSLIGNRARSLAVGVTIICIACLPSSLRGQGFSACGSNICASSGANVGIGTASPAQKLDVGGEANIQWSTRLGTVWSRYLKITGSNSPGAVTMQVANTLGVDASDSGVPLVLQPSAGNVGIGTTTPLTKLHVLGSSAASSSSQFNTAGQDVFIMEGSYPNLVLFDKKGFGSNAQSYSMRTNDTASGNYDDWVVGRRGYGDYFAIGRTLNNNNPTFGIGSPFFAIAPAGNVGIGTTVPQYKLSVNGTIGTKEVVVTNTGWADYVFKPDYRPMSLTEVSSYIDEHHHLPGIPSESEVQEKGVSLGDLQVKLLAKIEELTLHMIQTEAKTKRLEEQNRELQERISRIDGGRGDSPHQ